jgi:putative ABC transport system permease protein
MPSLLEIKGKNKMDFLELLDESKTSLTVNKIRTGLAMLGVIIGIGSVIALMGLGQASQKSITDQISSLGTNLITIMPSGTSSGGIKGATGTASSLDMDDAELLEKSSLITTLSEVAPYVSQNAQLVTSDNNTNSTVMGVTENYPTVNNLDLSSGTFITERHNLGLSRVVVLGPDVVTELFGEGVDPLGERIRISGQSFTVIGVAEAKGGTGRMNPDEYVYIPLDTAMKVVFGLDSLSAISVTAIDEDSADLATEQITTVLLQAHDIDNEDDADFRLFSQEDLLETVTEVTDTFTSLLSGIAAISLVVGGIGIMNIMLVTVTERTREIGLRKALGAKNQIIIYQFLLEAVLITVIGGLIGIAFGLAASYFISSKMGLSFVISYPSIALAFGVSVVIGLIFGLYPAKKAADLLPIEALRYE